jgi:hypothetical protein
VLAVANLSLHNLSLMVSAGLTGAEKSKDAPAIIKAGGSRLVRV